MGCGVIGNTADSGSVVLGSSPGTPAKLRPGSIMVAMSTTTTGRLVLAYNPRASFGKNAKVGPQTAEFLKGAGFDVVVCVAPSYAELEARVREEVTDSTKALVVVGGDGMVHLGVALCLDRRIPLAVIPSGTGNDLARHLGIPLDPIAAAARLMEALEGTPRRIDVAFATSPEGVATPYVCVLSAGFDAIVNERANQIRFPKGRHRYTVALLIELMKLRPRRYVVDIDGVDYSGDYLLVAVANSQSFGGGMKVTPEASVEDGLVDVLLVKPLSRLEFLRIYPRVFKGTHVTDPRVVIGRGQSVRVDSPDIVAFADGERISGLPIAIEVRPMALAVYA